MAFRVTNDFSGSTTLDMDKLDANFTDVETELDGGITTAHISSSAGITNAQLANSQFEFVVPLTLIKGDAATALSTSTTVPAAIAGLPGLSGDGTYTVTDANVYISDQGSASNTSIVVESGRVVSNAWSTATTIVASTNIAGDSDGNPEHANLTINTAAITLDSSNPTFIALFLTALATGALSATYSFLTVTLKIQRTNGLTS